MRAALGLLLGWLLRLWAASWRVSVSAPPELGEPTSRVFAFWHGQQMALLGARRPERAVVLVSHSRDGALQAGVMSALGFSVVRGSSSRGGAAGLRAVVRGARRDGVDALFAVDGPRGPRGRAKPGAATAAWLARAALVPVAAAATPKLLLARTWDRFEIPLPFARVSIVIGQPLDARAVRSHPRALDRALARLRREAAASLARTSEPAGRATAEPGPAHP